MAKQYKSVLNTSAHSHIPCVDVGQYNERDLSLEFINMALTRYSIIEAIMIDLLLSNGCRISEALSVESSNILDSKTVWVKGSKGSCDRILHLCYTSFPFEFIRGNTGRLFFGRDRFYFYRVFKNLGINERITGNRNRAVTHLPRHMFVDSVRTAGMESEMIAKNLGHKSVKSTKWYEEHRPE